MRKPPPVMVLAIAITVLASCVRVQVQPYPSPEARGSTSIRGVVLEGNGSDRRIEFEHVESVEWRDSTLTLTGERKTASRDAGGLVTTETLSFPLASVKGVLIRRVDVNRTSLLIAGLGLGSIIVATLLVNGKADKGTVLTGSRR